jgi:hypothetical protein
MGITIFYRGTVKSATERETVIAIAKDFSMQNSWPQTNLQNGVALYPHPDCEPIRIEFEGLRIDQFVKTQFAGAPIHVRVVALLREISPHFSVFEVSDDSEYWETGDEGLLEKAITDCQKAILACQAENPDVQIAVKLPSGKIVDVIE